MWDFRQKEIFSLDPDVQTQSRIYEKTFVICCSSAKLRRMSVKFKLSYWTGMCHGKTQYHLVT